MSDAPHEQKSPEAVEHLKQALEVGVIFSRASDQRGPPPLLAADADAHAPAPTQQNQKNRK
jgi:hypothetical protein